MKVRIYLSLLLISILSVTQLTAQQSDVIRCYTTEADAQLRAQYPELGTLEDFEAWLEPLVREYQENGSMRAVSTIPVIFHIIHNGESVGSGDNISATYVNAQITQLNNDFRKIAGTSGDNSNPVGADTEIEFCAATLDPSGSTLSEPGINRINRNSKGWTAPPYGSCTGGFNDAYIEGTIKPQSQWNPDDYLNIWVMDINCGILGYAQFPSSSGLGGLNSNGGAANTDGVVLLTTSLVVPQHQTLQAVLTTKDVLLHTRSDTSSVFAISGEMVVVPLTTSVLTHRLLMLPIMVAQQDMYLVTLQTW